MTLQRRGGAPPQQTTFCTQDCSILQNTVAIAWPKCYLLVLCLTWNRRWVSKESFSPHCHTVTEKLLTFLHGGHRVR